MKNITFENKYNKFIVIEPDKDKEFDFSISSSEDELTVFLTIDKAKSLVEFLQHHINLTK